MFSPSRCLQEPRSPVVTASARLAGCAVLVAGLACITQSDAQAAEPESMSFATPSLEWRAAPPELHLQPERARLILSLPPELMPAAPDPGRFGAIDPNHYFDFSSSTRFARASIGASMSIQVDDYAHSVHFKINFMPRGAVAQLRFDPTAIFR